MTRVLIVGCGYTGSAVGSYFSAQGARVWGMVRTGIRAKELSLLGISPIIADLTQPRTLKKIPSADFVLISAAPDKRDKLSYQKTYLEGVKNFLLSFEKNERPQCLIYLSSTGVYANRSGGWVDEKTPPVPDTPEGTILLRTEEEVLQSGVPSIILRLGGIYGLERNRIRSLREGRWPRPNEQDSYINLIHVDDIVAGVNLLFKKGERQSVYLGVDDRPVKKSTLCRWLCRKIKMPNPSRAFARKEVDGKRCRNARLKELGFSLKYPTFREGYQEFLTAL